MLTRRLAALSNRYFDSQKSGRTATYEEVAYVAGQLAAAITSFEYENPALHPLIQQLARRIGAGGLAKLKDEAVASRRYISDSVVAMLDRRIGCLVYLDAILDSAGAREIDLFSLNQDLVLETALKRRDLAFTDGFTRVEGDLRFWSADFSGAPIRLFKLHGSISWHRFTDLEAWRGQQVAICDHGDYEHARDPHGELFALGDYGEPVMLTGTFDKILQYETNPFLDQFFEFYERLNRRSRVVVIGYGFGDKAIDSRLISWMLGALDRRMVVIHPDPAKLRDHARGAIHGKWAAWESAGRLRIVPRRLEHTSWDEIETSVLGDAV